MSLVLRHLRVHRDPPHVRDVANAPLSGRVGRYKLTIWVRGQELFLKTRNAFRFGNPGKVNARRPLFTVIAK